MDREHDVDGVNHDSTTVLVRQGVNVQVGLNGHSFQSPCVQVN